MDKQIEELRLIIAESLASYSKAKLPYIEALTACVTNIIALGYRKIPENAVVLTREEAETIYGTLKANEEFIFDLQEVAMVCKKEMEEAQEVTVKEIEEYVQQARKETAEKYHAEMVKAIESVPNATKEFVEAWKAKNDEIAKDITEGV